MGFCFGRGNVAEGFKQTPVVVPVDPFQGREFDTIGAVPRALAADQFGLEQADDRLRQGIVVGVADGGVLAACDASLCVQGFRPVPPVVMLCRCSARSSLVDHCWLPLDVDRACAPAGWLVMDEPASCEVWDRAAC